MSTCGCRCHTTSADIGCDREHDKGSSGVAGIPSCSPCGNDAELSDAVCVLAHPEREERWSGLLCKRHRRQMDHDVTEIGLLIIDSQRIIDGGAPTETGGGSGKRKKRADPPAPGDLGIMALFDSRSTTAPIPETKARNWNANTGRMESNAAGEMPSVLSIVASWLLLVAEERPLTSALPQSVLGQLDLLHRHHEWLAAQPYVDDYLLEMGELRKALAQVVRDHKARRIGTCDLPTDDGPKCGGALIIDNGSDVIRCVSCRAQWITPDEQARLAVRL